jgi:hypothetical protein
VLCFVSLCEQVLYQRLVLVPIDCLGFQRSILRFGQRVQIEIGNRAEKICICVIYWVQIKRAFRQVQYLIPNNLYQPLTPAIFRDGFLAMLGLCEPGLSLHSSRSSAR